MKINLSSNNLGFSLITAITALAVVTATTAYLINLSKNSSLVSAAAKTTIYIEAERSRISTVLADNTTCMLAANFGGSQPALRVSIPGLVAANGLPLITQNMQYYDKALRIDSIQTRLAVSGDPVETTDLATDKGYILQINYIDNTPANSRSSYTGKKQSIINIPMYMKVVSGNVAECYAYAQNSQVNKAVQASCSPASTLLKKNSLLNLNGAIESDCQHEITFANPSPANNTTCPSTASNVAPSNFTALSGWDLTTMPVASTIDIPISKCSGIATACAIPTQTPYGISNSVSVCAYTGGMPRDNGCTAGQILYHTTGAASICTTVICPFAYSFVNSISSGGAGCHTAPATNCAANEYVKEFNSTGSDVCGILPIMSGTCGGGFFGQSITRNNATADGTLNCTAYNKSKACSPAAAYTFATAFGASATATCKAF